MTHYGWDGFGEMSDYLKATGQMDSTNEQIKGITNEDRLSLEADPNIEKYKQSAASSVFKTTKDIAKEMDSPHYSYNRACYFIDMALSEPTNSTSNQVVKLHYITTLVQSSLYYSI